MRSRVCVCVCACVCVCVCEESSQLARAMDDEDEQVARWGEHKLHNTKLSRALPHLSPLHHHSSQARPRHPSHPSGGPRIAVSPRLDARFLFFRGDHP